MPNFEILIMSAPAGFAQCCNELNLLANSNPTILEKFIIKSLKSTSFVPSDSLETQYTKEIKAINFIIRSYRTSNPVPTFPQMASALDQHSLLTRETVEKIIISIQENSNENEAIFPLLSQVSL